MSKLFRFQPLTTLAFTGLAVASMLTGCSEDNPLSSATDGLCCNSFAVGADLSGADFGLEGDVKGKFKVFAQAGSDLAVVANGALTDVAVACENIARDLGVSADKVDAANAKTGSARVTALCDLASAELKSSFSATGSLKATVDVDFQPPVCTASIDAQASCQGSCSVDAKCDADVAPPKCTGGKLTVECSGTCSAKAGVDVSCTGQCTGECSGSCTAEAGATVDCDGTCEGTCTVDGKANSASGVAADGTCKGKCDGKCTAKANAKVDCSGTCEGSCTAECKAKAGVKFTCDGECEGDFEAPKCEGGKAEVDCNVDAECKANCSASASAKADCKPPRLAVVVTGAGMADADLRVKIDAAVASLEANLPNLLVVVKARGTTFVSGIEASVSAGAKLTDNIGDLSGEAVFCLPKIASAIGTASSDFKATLAASLKVTGAVNID